MAKNRVLLNPNQQAPLMSSPHTNTLTIVAEDDDDNDICPVCDGQCTCSNNTSSFYRQPPVATTAPSPPARDPTKPILKIRLPPNLLKRKLPQPTAGPSTAPPTQSQHVPKRRGRPPKNPALRAGLGVAGPSTSAYQRPKSKPVPRFPQKRSLKSTTNGGVQKKLIKKRKRVDSDAESLPSELTDIDDDDDDNDARSIGFPTFLSASAISSVISSTSSASSSDAGSLSGFETDSSIEAEEESFILNEERARVRRELLNGGEESMQKRRDTNWVIRPRQLSVGAPSDVDMDGDSDATEDADDDEDEEEEDDDEPDDEDTEDTDVRRHGYAGLVTAWSDDEESSFDADLFFANLSDQESSGSSTQSDDGEDGDYFDLEHDLSETAASLIPHLRQGVGIGIPNLAFEVTEGWDGQVLFTNGLVESSSQGGLRSLLETAFLPSGPETSPSPGPDGDVEMLSTDADGEADEEGYEQDIDQDTAEAEGEGDTTDEELVGEDDLPNERAMSLFNTPFSFRNVASINPLSTLSPTSSPCSYRGQQSFDSPRPSDILAQRMAAWGTADIEEEFEGEELEEEDEESASVREQKEKERAARGGLPRTGLFEVSEKARQAIINGEHAIPSSYPKFTGRRSKNVKSMSLSMSREGRAEEFESLLRRSFSTYLRPSSLPPSSTRDNFPLSPSNEAGEDTTLPPNAAITSPEPHSESLLEEPAAQPMSIDLDDVLDASFLESNDTPNTDPNAGSSIAASTSSDGDPSARRYIQGLNRWDVISVGALRKTGVLTDSTAGWGSDSGPDYTAYSNVMKSSPLSTMLWHNRNGAPKQQRSMGQAMSPELGPVKDGDRTPTPQKQSPPFNAKSRKELRKERKLKRKSHGPINHPKQHRLHHQHNHHPNSKYRSTSSSQRASAAVPPLTI